MSKKVKNLITRELTDRFKELDGVAVINPRGINAIKNNQIRRRLHEKGLRMTVVKNTLARRAVGDGSKIKGFDKLLDGPSAVIYGKASIPTIARLLLDEKKTDEKLELRGIFFDGEVYIGDKGVEQVSKLPTREEAIGNAGRACCSRPAASSPPPSRAPAASSARSSRRSKRRAEPAEAAADAEAAAARRSEAAAAAPAAACSDELPVRPAGDRRYAAAADKR